MKSSKKLIPILMAAAMLAGCSTTGTDTTADTAATTAATTSSTTPDVSIFTEAKTTQYFSDEAVPESDIKTILDAGANAESGMNAQPWYFTAVSNTALLADLKAAISANMPAEMQDNPLAKAQLGDSPLAIVVSVEEGNEFDAGLACQNMLNTAQALGYGTKIVSSPASILNSEYKSELSIPEQYTVVAVLLVGKVDDTIDMEADGVTSASIREYTEDVSTIIK